MPNLSIASPISISNNRIDVGNVKPPFDGNQILGYETVAGATTTLYTVPAGYQFLLYGWTLSTKVSIATTYYSYMEIRSDGGTRYAMLALLTGSSGGVSGPISCALHVPIVLPAGWLIAASSQNITAPCYPTFYGIETKV